MILKIINIFYKLFNFDIILKTRRFFKRSECFFKNEMRDINKFFFDLLNVAKL